jgi:hypothetical protein
VSRDLGDVLHYFIDGAPAAGRRVLAVPLGERDLVRSALVLGLAAELASAGRPAVLAAPGACEALGHAESASPQGVERVASDAGDAGALAAHVEALLGEASAGRRGIVLAPLPPAWIDGSSRPGALLDWSLVLATPQPRDLDRAFGLLARIDLAAPGGRLGVTVHGIRDLDEARDAFLALAVRSESELGRPLLSYGCLLDDLDVCRALVARRPLGLVRPASRAARALRDVARLLAEDAAAA